MCQRVGRVSTPTRDYDLTRHESIAIKTFGNRLKLSWSKIVNQKVTVYWQIFSYGCLNLRTKQNEVQNYMKLDKHTYCNRICINGIINLYNSSKLKPELFFFCISCIAVLRPAQIFSTYLKTYWGYIYFGCHRRGRLPVHRRGESRSSRKKWNWSKQQSLRICSWVEDPI